MCPRNVFNRMVFDKIRPRNSSMSFCSQVSLLHTLLGLLPDILTLESSSWNLSSVISSSFRSSPHPCIITSRLVCWWLVSSLWDRSILTSWRTIESPRTLWVRLVGFLKLKNGYNNLLGGNCLELPWATNKSFADLVCKFGHCDEVAYTKTEAHG